MPQRSAEKILVRRWLDPTNDELEMAADDARKYVYSALPPNFIRTLELQPELGHDAELKCRLIAQRIQDGPYEALSYVWGKPTVFHSSIYCIDDKDENDEGIIPIGANLTKALVAYRLHDRPRRIWVDAICINQEDLAERQAQVRMMGPIFRGADRVLCWLGGFNNPELDEPAALIAIGFLRQFNQDQVGELRKVQQYLHHDVKTQEDEIIHMSWLGIKILFDIEYFHRAWIIQEVGLARRTKISWGRSEICVDWEEIARFSSFMDANGASVVNHFNLKSWVCNHISMVWTMKPDGHPVYDFSEVLHWARIHISTDPRDYVYALLGHPSAIVAGEFIIEPNYTISKSEVYTSLALNTIRRTNSIHILAFVDHGEEFGSTDLPSWVPDWHAPNLVAPLRFPTQATPKVVDSIILEPEKNMVRCQGFLLDQIVAISDMITPKELPVTTYEAELKKNVSFLFDHLHEKLVVEASIPLDSWEDIVFGLSSILSGAIRNDDDAVTGPTLKQQRADCAAYISRFEKIKPDIHTSGLLHSLQPEERVAFEELASTGSAAQFIQDMTWTSMCRKVFRTPKGHFGLGPRIMEKGDICVIVFGSVYPLILRKHNEHYQLVGPALLHGYMNQEAIEAGHKGVLQQQEICILLDVFTDTSYSTVGPLQDRLQVGAGLHSVGHFTYGGEPGGDIYTSPTDPMFWLHHGMIERTWQNQQPLERVLQITGTQTINNSPASPNVAVEDIIDLFFVTPKGGPTSVIKIRVSTVAGLYCYIYL
ncbi:putative Heterokaryon incompatibility domain-containing protein [Seiridium unicorne]|uniref:Heterokaryon incompatibility domain-containing protein n=1 Tax=Seiridium unicorne TaxID=138068 RepID=A0ABR2V370_9PEZI